VVNYFSAVAVSWKVVDL